MVFPHGLRALNHRDFRRFYFSQLAAQVGSWMQNVAQAWLVLQLTDSPFKLGLLATLQFSPVLLFSIVSGAVADRLPKRPLVVATQTTLALQGLLLALLVATGHVQYWHVAVLGLALGFANVVDQPARQSFVMELVGRADVSSAVALNSAGFNLARIVGPAVAGVVIGRLGVAPTFFVNSLGFLGVIVTLLRMKVPDPPPRTARATILDEIAEGVRYAVPLLFFTGFWGIMLMASWNTSIQLQAPDVMRGRVMSLYTWVSGGVFPIGAFIVGTIAQWWGVSAAFLWNGTVGLAALGALALWWRFRRD